MGIAPIPGIRPLPGGIASRTDDRPPEIFDVGGSEKPGDGERQRNGRKASGAEDNDPDDLLMDAETELGEGSEDSTSLINYFA